MKIIFKMIIAHLLIYVPSGLNDPLVVGAHVMVLPDMEFAAQAMDLMNNQLDLLHMPEELHFQRCI